MKLDVDRLHFAPCIPAGWKSFMLHYRYFETFYHIRVERTGVGSRVVNVMVDGLEQNDGVVHLNDDRKEHNVVIKLG
jgi:cellobiose phosphorylase